jgi:hypothetical protein
MPQPNDLSRSLVALDQNSTIIAVVEMSQSSWLVGGVVPSIERQPCITELDAPDRSQITAPQHAHRTVTGIRHKYTIRRGEISNALRLAQTGDSTQYLARCQIDHTQAVVAELRYKKPLPLHIDAEVIDAAAHLAKRYFRLEYQRRARLRTCRGGPEEARDQKDRPPQHA